MTIESTRAELPVSTTDWHSTSNSRGQFIPIHGLDFLIGATNLQIQQTVELNDREYLNYFYISSKVFITCIVRTAAC